MEMYKKIKSIAEDGYSLVELVAAVGLLMLLTSVVGVASYNTINSKQTREAVRLSTQSAYNKALAAVTDYSDETTVAEALKEPAKEAAQRGVTLEYLPEEPTKESLCVIGRVNGDVKNEYSYKIGPKDCVTTTSKGLPPAEDQTLPSYTKAEEITKISYICDGTGTRNARLNISNIKEGTRATLFGDDQSIIPVEFSATSAKNSEIKYRDSKESPTIKNVSDTFEIKKGVEYELVVDGKFDNIGTLQHGSSGTSLDMTDCMTKISELGKDNGVIEISSYEATKFSEIDVVKLPSTVTSIRYMFDSAPIDDSDVSSWNTGKITDMRGVFYGAKNFNQPLSSWETKEVTDMSYMFKDASKFSQHLNTSGNKWNTIKVDNMGYMFSGATSFNGTMNSWNVSTVRNMKAMFEEADNFNQDINSWSTVNVNNMSRMFYGADKYNKPLINKWNTSSVTTMESMFEGAGSFNNGSKELNWDTSNVIYMNSMFKDATSFNRSVNSWAIDQVLDMSYMFNNATSFNQSVSDWRTRQTLNFVGMFQNATSFNNGYAKGVGGDSNPDNYILMAWNLDNPDGSTRRIDVSYMFMGAVSFNSNFGNLSKGDKFQWNRVTTARSMFENASSFNATIGDLTSTGNVNNMMSMFRYATSFNQDLTNLRTTNSTTLASMFEYAENFNNGAPIGVHGKPLNWDTAKVTVMSYTFAWTSFNQDMNGTMDNVTTTLGMFYGALEFNSVLKGMYTADNNTSMDSMFQNTPKFNAPGASTWSTKNVTNMEDVFRSSHSFNRDIQAWDVRKVTNMKGMFWGAEAFNQLIWEWDTTNVTDMSYMFAYTWAFDQPLTNNEAAGKKWDTSNVTNMEYMFQKAEKFQNRAGTTWDLSLNTSKVTNMKGMFERASIFNLNLDHLDTKNVTDMSYMFSGSIFNNGVATNSGVAPIRWDTGKVTDMSYMFAEANYNQHFYSSMKNVTTTRGMFKNNTWLKGADFSGLRQVNSITDMSYMYAGATNFKSTTDRAPNYYTNNVKRFDNMFNGAVSFSQDLSGWNTSSMTHYTNFAKNSNMTASQLPPRFAKSSSGL